MMHVMNEMVFFVRVCLHHRHCLLYLWHLSKSIIDMSIHHYVRFVVESQSVSD